MTRLTPRKSRPRPSHDANRRSRCGESQYTHGRDTPRGPLWSRAGLVMRIRCVDYGLLLGPPVLGFVTPGADDGCDGWVCAGGLPGVFTSMLAAPPWKSAPNGPANRNHSTATTIASTISMVEQLRPAALVRSPVSSR